MRPDQSTIRRLLRPEFILVAAFGLVAAASLMRPSAPPEPAKVATVDLEKVFNSLKRYDAEQTRVKALSEELDRQVKTAETQVRELQSELDSFKEGSKEQLDTIAKLQSAIGELKAVQNFVGSKIEAEKGRAVRDTYLAIKDAIRRLAEKEGIDYVMLDDSVVDMAGTMSTAKAMEQISARRFLFANPRRDLTAQLIGFMNNEWKGG